MACSLRAASLTALLPKVTTHELLLARRWIEVISSISIPALSKPVIISWLVITESTEKQTDSSLRIRTLFPRTTQLVNDAQNSGVLAMRQVIPGGDQNHTSNFRFPVGATVTGGGG